MVVSQEENLGKSWMKLSEKISQESQQELN